MPSQASRAARAYREHRDMEANAVKVARRIPLEDGMTLRGAEPGKTVTLLAYPDGSIAYQTDGSRNAYVLPNHHREWAEYELAKRRPEGDRK